MINVIEAGKEVIRREFPIYGEGLLHAMNQGSHVLNPYHNVEHELAVVYWCSVLAEGLSAFEDVHPLSEIAKRVLITAAAFHDHNHSGGLKDDHFNISAARDFVSKSELTRPVFRYDGEAGSERILSTIEVTKFVAGGFPYVPGNSMQRILRDADLMMIYTHEGRQILAGLPEEMGLPPMDSKERVDEWIEGTRKFQTAATLFTKQAQMIRERYLDKSLEALRSLMWPYGDHYRHVMLTNSK